MSLDFMSPTKRPAHFSTPREASRNVMRSGHAQAGLSLLTRQLSPPKCRFVSAGILRGKRSCEESSRAKSTVHGGTLRGFAEAREYSMSLRLSKSRG